MFHVEPKDMQILGYTLKQWGYVGAWYQRNIGPIDCSYDGLIDVQAEYMCRYQAEPLSVEFEGIKPEIDYDLMRRICMIQKTF